MLRLVRAREFVSHTHTHTHTHTHILVGRCEWVSQGARDSRDGRELPRQEGERREGGRERGAGKKVRKERRDGGREGTCERVPEVPLDLKP